MKRTACMFAALLAAGVALNAESAAPKNQVVVAHAQTLSADEQAFSAKLSAEARKAFTGFSETQRQAVMVAVNNGANADEAVHHMVTAQEIKATAAAETAPATEATK
ncbi:MAG: hypothetical protein RLZZ453_592 [Chlamydiota bacterium]|jgi:hypothetical protein